MKVLIVDDESLIRRSLTRAFQARGHVVRAAADGVEGLSAWRESPPELAIVDVLMPGLTGPQLLQQVTIAETRVILISAYTGDFDINKAKDLGAHLFLPKPFENIFEIVECAENLVKNKAV